MFPSLQILNLNGNMITQMSLDTCIEICGEIPEVGFHWKLFSAWIRISDWSVDSRQNMTENIFKITQLHLSDNHLTEIPKIAFQFAKLTLLDLR